MTDSWIDRRRLHLVIRYKLPATIMTIMLETTGTKTASTRNRHCIMRHCHKVRPCVSRVKLFFAIPIVLWYWIRDDGIRWNRQQERNRSLLSGRPCNGAFPMATRIQRQTGRIACSGVSFLRMQRSSSRSRLPSAGTSKHSTICSNTPATTDLSFPFARTSKRMPRNAWPAKSLNFQVTSFRRGLINKT